MKNVMTLAAVALFASTSAHAQLSQNNGCTPSAQNCTGSNQNSGDTSTANNYGDSHSTTAQLGNSSGSISSGNDTSFDNRAQTTQNANNTTTGTISGGNTSSNASGNLSNNDNHSSVGNTSSNSGGNTLGTASNATVGNTSAAGGAGGAGGSSLQGQQQGQTARLTGGNSTSGSTSSTGASRSLSAATGGNQRQAATGGNASGAANANGAGQRTSLNGGNTNVGGTSYSDNSHVDARALVLPPMVPPTPPSSVAVGNVVVQTMACGPLKQVEQTPIIGTYFGFFTKEKINQGFTYDLVDFRDENDRIVRYHYEQDQAGRTHIYGSQAVIMATVVSIAGARNFAMGGGAGVGPNGQIGGGSSAAMSQLVTNIQVSECEVGILQPAAAEVFAPIPMPELPATPVPHVKRKIVARRAKPCAIPKI